MDMKELAKSTVPRVIREPKRPPKKVEKADQPKEEEEPE